jgi:hypothetical protein
MWQTLMRAGFSWAWTALSGFGRRVRTDDAEELVRQVANLANGNVDPLGKARRVQSVLCTGNDPQVRLALPMKAFEIGMIVRKDSTSIGCCIREHFRVVDALASPTRLLYRPYVVTETAQFLHNRQREILVRIEFGHA